MADAVISPNPRSIARVFADVNHKKGREYWDYEQLNVSATPPLSSPCVTVTRMLFRNAFPVPTAPPPRTANSLCR